MLAHALGVGVIFHVDRRRLRHRPSWAISRPRTRRQARRNPARGARRVIGTGQCDARRSGAPGLPGSPAQPAAASPIHRLGQKCAEILRRARFLSVKHAARKSPDPMERNEPSSANTAEKSAQPVDCQQLRTAPHRPPPRSASTTEPRSQDTTILMTVGGLMPVFLICALETAPRSRMKSYTTCRFMPFRRTAMLLLSIRNVSLPVYCAENAPSIRAGRFQTRCGMTAFLLITSAKRISRPNRRRTH